MQIRPVRVILSLVLLLLLLITVTACMKEKMPTPQSPTAETESKQNAIKVYYGDQSMAQLQERELTISYRNDEEKYSASLQALKNSPDNSLIPLFQWVTFRTIKQQNGILTVDLSIGQQGHFGASGEELFLEALKKTLFQFAEVKSIELLVEGNKAESLMGHIALPHPIERNS